MALVPSACLDEEGVAFVPSVCLEEEGVVVAAVGTGVEEGEGPFEVLAVSESGASQNHYLHHNGRH